MPVSGLVFLPFHHQGGINWLGPPVSERMPKCLGRHSPLRHEQSIAGLLPVSPGDKVTIGPLQPNQPGRLLGGRSRWGAHAC